MPTAALPIALLGPEPWQTGDLRKEGSAVAGCSAAFVRMVGNPLTNPHEREVAVPSLWPRPGGVLQQHGLGVTRPSDNLTANITDGRYSSNWNRTQLTSRRRSLTSSLVKGFVSLFGLCGGVLLLQTWCDPARNRS